MLLRVILYSNLKTVLRMKILYTDQISALIKVKSETIYSSITTVVPVSPRKTYKECKLGAYTIPKVS